MRRTATIGLIALFTLFMAACNKASPLSKGTGGIQQSIVESPTTETKTDRPTETGEGLPGYLIDPAKLAMESKDGQWTVTGTVGAVRHQNGNAESLNVWMIKVAKSTAKFAKQNQNWQLSGTLVASVKADEQGAFILKGSIRTDDLLFVKLEDSSGPNIHYKSGVVATSVLWIDGQTAKPMDSSNAAQISAQVTAAQPSPNAAELARLIEQIKTTGQCRNCNLVGADLSGLDIAACDLSFSNLMGAKFVLTNLSRCTITNSNLSQADFSQANLAGANLSSSDVAGAIFTGANVEGLTGASVPVQ